MSKKDITSLRGTLDYLMEKKQILVSEKEVSVNYDVAGIVKALEGASGAYFENVKDFPNTRIVGEYAARIEVLADLFDVEDPKKLKFKCYDAIRKPLPPKIVDEAPCQEVVITENIDVLATIPIIKHTPRDAGRILGGGIILISGEHCNDGTDTFGSDMCYKRMHFRGKDWSTITIGPTTHLGDAYFTKHWKKNIPCTINIGTNPACAMVAATAFVRATVPFGSDELGYAGALQGTPVEIVKAKTVDAYSIADSEWVIEGYLTPEREWESEEAEKEGADNKIHFFPEWPGYIGKCWKSPKFVATAITHRKEKPILFVPLAHSFAAENIAFPFREASFWDFANRIEPGLVVDMNMLHGMKWGGAPVIQVKKRKPLDNGLTRNLLQAMLAAHLGMRLVIIVDEDIDIYSAEDVLWAIMTRSNPDIDFVKGIGGATGTAAMPTERQEVRGQGGHTGTLGIDATVPIQEREHFSRSGYPVDLVKLEEWFEKSDIAEALSHQPEYAQVLARIGG